MSGIPRGARSSQALKEAEAHELAHKPCVPAVCGQQNAMKYSQTIEVQMWEFWYMRQDSRISLAATEMFKV